MIYIIVLAIIALFGPHLWARHVLNRYNRQEYFSGNGIDLARLVLEHLNLNDVKVEVTDTADHYDPSQKKIRLTENTCGRKTLTSVVVAAHEVGHAIQDQPGAVGWCLDVSGWIGHPGHSGPGAPPDASHRV